jgi:hypothetical protein
MITIHVLGPEDPERFFRVTAIDAIAFERRKDEGSRPAVIAVAIRTDEGIGELRKLVTIPQVIDLLDASLYFRM